MLHHYICNSFWWHVPDIKWFSSAHIELFWSTEERIEKGRRWKYNNPNIRDLTQHYINPTPRSSHLGQHRDSGWRHFRAGENIWAQIDVLQEEDLFFSWLFIEIPVWYLAFNSRSFFIWWGLIIYLMRYGNLLHVFSNIFMSILHFPSRLDFCRDIVRLKIRIQWEVSAFSTTQALGDDKKWEWINLPPTNNVTNKQHSCPARVKCIWETRTNVYCFALCWFSSIWYVATCSHYTFYCL